MFEMASPEQMLFGLFLSAAWLFALTVLVAGAMGLIVGVLEYRSRLTKGQQDRLVELHLYAEAMRVCTAAQRGAQA